MIDVHRQDTLVAKSRECHRRLLDNFSLIIDLEIQSSNEKRKAAQSVADRRGPNYFHDGGWLQLHRGRDAPGALNGLARSTGRPILRSVQPE
jgi:hypothetical protein